MQNAASSSSAAGSDPRSMKKDIINNPRRGRSTADRSNQLCLAVVGHVDAGKSTLFGKLLYDLGDIDERTMQKLKRDSTKIQKSSFAFAWAMDSSTEERERGVTIDIATNNFKSNGKSFTILDAPGHRDFVPNMIAGASQADFAIMVVDASRDAFESGFDASGQTKEHAILLRALGIQRVIVAVNKLDNVEWSQDRFKDIRIQMTTFLNHIGFDSSALSFIPCSGLTGENVASPMRTADVDWYTGRSLLQEMETITDLSVKDAKAPFRMIIADVRSSPNSSNVTVQGRISSGELQKKDTVLCMPSGEIATVRQMTIEDETETSFAGDDLYLTLSDIDPMHLRRGDVLCHLDHPVVNAAAFTMQMVTFEMLRPLLTGSSIVLHRGRADVPAVVKSIEVPTKKQAGETRKVRHVTGGNSCLITVELIRGIIPLEPFSVTKDLGRIIVRREGDTIGAGVVMTLL